VCRSSASGGRRSSFPQTGAPVFLARKGTVVALLLSVALGSCSPAASEESAVERGDVAFARDSLDEALAEYLLALRQGADDPEVLARIAHTHVRLGRVDDAHDFYMRAIQVAPDLADQAAADLAWMARRAADQGERFQMSSAMTAALEIRPGLGVEELALPLARHLSESGQYGRALPFYQKALAARDSAPDLVFEIGRVHEEIGDCERALVYFEQYREMIRPWERDQVDWYIGSCSFRTAQAKRQEARRLARGGGGGADADAAGQTLLEEGRRLVERTLELGEPRTVLARAWFERGEILSALGECDAAVESFAEVRFLEPSENTALARRAQERLDQLRFGRGLSALRSGGGCG